MGHHDSTVPPAPVSPQCPRHQGVDKLGKGRQPGSVRRQLECQQPRRQRGNEESQRCSKGEDTSGLIHFAQPSSYNELELGYSQENSLPQLIEVLYHLARPGGNSP
jgi:hypothetical protein